MNTLSRIWIISLAFGGLSAADLPIKRPLPYYRPLWENSPFTSKPAPTGPEMAFNPLEDFVLLGVSPIADANRPSAVAKGYRVRMLNRKKATDPPIVVESGRATQGFEIIDVIYQKGDPRATMVKMKSGNTVGNVVFEEKFLKLAAGAAKTNAPRTLPAPVANGVTPPPNGTLPPNARRPRPRVIPPPLPVDKPTPSATLRR